MSWDEIYNQTKRELGHEPTSEEVQNRMVNAEFDIDSVFHKTTRIEEIVDCHNCTAYDYCICDPKTCGGFIKTN